MGQLPNYLLYDAGQSAHFGGENIISTHRLLYDLSDSMIRHQYWREDNVWRKAGGIGYRLLKLALLDVQQDFMLALTQHEVFGHGTRMREYDYQGISYKLRPLPPYGSGGGVARWISQSSDY